MKKNIPFLILALFLYLSPLANLLGQTGLIRGQIFDETGLTLPGAEVLLDSDKTIGTPTDVYGKFTLLQIPEGKQKITISFIGYRTKTIEVDVKPEEPVDIEVSLELESLSVNEVILTGTSIKGQAKALNQQKSLATISNIVSADQVGRFPDANIGDAMKRIPGITMQYDQGEARFGLIRGTSRDLSSVTINGERVPSAEGGERSVQLDLIPSDMVQTIEISKALTPDMDADAIGGTANLVTRSAPLKTRISLTAASGYNFLSDKPIWTAGGVLGLRLFENKLGVVLSGSFNNHQLGSHNIEAEWEQDLNDNNKNNDKTEAYLSDFQVRRYDVQRIRRSLSLALDYKFGTHSTLYLRGMYNHRDDWENRYRLRYKLDAPDENNISNAEIA